MKRYNNRNKAEVIKQETAKSETANGPVRKRKRCDEEVLPKKRKCQCRHCDGIFEGRHKLDVHQNTQRCSLEQTLASRGSFR